MAELLSPANEQKACPLSTSGEKLVLVGASEPEGKKASEIGTRRHRLTGRCMSMCRDHPPQLHVVGIRKMDIEGRRHLPALYLLGDEGLVDFAAKGHRGS